MNLFRSEEHVRRWALFDPASEDGIRPIQEFAALFSLPMFRERSALDLPETPARAAAGTLGRRRTLRQRFTVLGRASAVLIFPPVPALG